MTIMQGGRNTYLIIYPLVSPKQIVHGPEVV